MLQAAASSPACRGEGLSMASICYVTRVLCSGRIPSFENHTQAICRKQIMLHEAIEPACRTSR